MTVRPAVAAAVAIAVAGALIAPRLFGVGPTGIHDLSVLAPTITVCDRHDRGGATLRSLDDIRADGIEPVLVDPAPLARCTGHDPGNHPCTRDPDAAPCATVVYVRVAADAYAVYELVGGP